ncbi:universal stress protein [Phycisphaerales bacterium AB-hyl4]|uniref:Universal stress protein n=1 Tax=Natronomicrosphaera hydrolytica TaxID=3242702 RepID=A0ABV4UA98_9BACT
MYASVAQTHMLHMRHGGSHAEVRFPQRVLVYLPRSPRAAALAAEAWAIAQGAGAECQFLFIGPHDDDTRHDLRRALARAQVPSSVPLQIRTGKLRRVIRQVVQKHGIDLVITDTTSRHTTFLRHLCSTAGQIVTAAPCSVLLLIEPALERRPLERFVVSVDFDDSSRTMLGSVLHWGRCEQAEQWHLIHEYDPSGFYSLLSRLEPESPSRRMVRLGNFIRPFDWSGLHIHRLCLCNKHGCDAIWYAEAVRADVLCLPLSARRQAFWERVLRFRLDVDVPALPRAILLFRGESGRLSDEDKVAA